MKVTINARDLFRGEKNGGLEFGEWLALNDEGKLKQRLSFIASRANALSETPYDVDYGMPANVWADAQLLHQTAATALTAANDRDFLTASSLALDAGRMLAEINGLLPVYDGLKLTITQRESNSKGGKSSSRRLWAELLADHLVGIGVSFPKSWISITEDEINPLELNEDLAFYRSNDGGTVIAIDIVPEPAKEIGSMSRSNFEKRYFRDAKKKSGQ